MVLGRSKNEEKLISINDQENNLDIPYVEGKLLSEKWIRNLIIEKTDIRIVYPSWVVGTGTLKETPPNVFLKNLANKKHRFLVNGGFQ